MRTLQNQLLTTTSRAIAVLVTAIPWLFACGVDDGSSPGSSDDDGLCAEVMCAAGLVCVEGVCTDPGAADTGGGPGSGMAEGNNPADGTDDGADVADGPDADDGVDSMPATDSDGQMVYCGGDDENGCLCGLTPDWGSLGESCSPADVGEPAMCCGSNGWPSSGGCSCWSISCRLLSPFNETCTCNIGDVDPEDMAVDTCSTAKGVCCKDTDDGSCTCWDDLTACAFEDQVEVASCSVTDFDCGNDTQVTACN